MVNANVFSICSAQTRFPANERSSIPQYKHTKPNEFKHEQLVQYILDLESLNKNVDVIAVQEIWEIRFPELVNIPGFKPLVFKKRRNMRGGGVCFYIRNNLNAVVLEEFSPFVNNLNQLQYSSRIPPQSISAIQYLIIRVKLVKGYLFI
jgi:hypothetical protein